MRLRKVTLYSKQNCGLCSAAKDKLSRLGVEYQVRDIDYITSLHDGWREDGSIDVMAGHSTINNHIPMIQIDDRYYNYTGAMKELKRGR